ncbi:MAG TPA: hypothetical protein VFJ58_04750 [Armatimonadota bacterium]|nr:hypothetical protein [Armatimonadota bacterium]
MAILIDTNVLGRRAQRAHPMHQAATAALELLMDHGEMLYVAAQNLMEFWAVATGPAGVNGLGLTLEEAGLELDDVEQAFEPSRKRRLCMRHSGGWYARREWLDGRCMTPTWQPRCLLTA